MLLYDKIIIPIGRYVIIHHLYSHLGINMPKLSNITPEQYVIINTVQHSSLYGGMSFDSAKLAIMDHLLSTIGNGITFEDFLHNIKLHKHNKELLSREYKHLFDGTPMYYIDKLPQDNKNSMYKERLTNPKTGEEVFTLSMDEIKEFGWDNPKEYRWFKNSHKEPGKWAPYPYFSKQYNMLWDNQKELQKVPVPFLRAFIDYYKVTLDFFTTDKQYLHHYACPRPDDDAAWETALKKWQEIYEKNTKSVEGDEEKMKHFSKDYATEYNGNMREFLELRHRNEVNKCIDFIKETIEMLEDTITNT